MGERVRSGVQLTVRDANLARYDGHGVGVSRNLTFDEPVNATNGGESGIQGVR